MTHEHVQDLLPAYALDALTPEEARAVEAHLAGCRQCQRDLAAFTTVAATMADSVVMTTPPPALRARVMEAVRAERPPARPAAQPAPLWPRQWAVGAIAAAAGFIVVIGALAIIAVARVAALDAQLSRQNQQLTVLTSRLAQQEQLFAVVVNPGAKKATLAGAVVADVQFVYDPAVRQGALIVRNLADPQQGFVYQLWLVGASGPPLSAGVFRPAAGRSLVLPVTADFSRVKAIAISVERGPDGAPQPTAVPILSATL